MRYRIEVNAYERLLRKVHALDRQQFEMTRVVLFSFYVCILFLVALQLTPGLNFGSISFEADTPLIAKQLDAFVRSSRVLACLDSRYRFRE